MTDPEYHPRTTRAAVCAILLTMKSSMFTNQALAQVPESILILIQLCNLGSSCSFLSQPRQLRLCLDETCHQVEAVPVRLEVEVLRHRGPRRAALGFRHRTQQPMLGCDAHDADPARRVDCGQRHELVPALAVDSADTSQKHECTRTRRRLRTSGASARGRGP